MPQQGTPHVRGGLLAAYPDATVYAAPGLSEKRPDLPFHRVLGDAPESGWNRDLEQTIFRGDRVLREVVFCHRESGTLIVADLLQTDDPASPLFTRLVKRVNGIHEKPRPLLPFRLGFRDKSAARASLERVLSWDFDRIVLCHGPIVESGGKAVFREAYSFLSLP